MKNSWRIPSQALVAAICVFWGGTARAQYETVTVTDGGSVTGTVKWSGARPQPVTLPITKDPTVCDINGNKTRDLERIIIAPDGAVENTVVYLKDITKGKAMDMPAAERTLDQKNCKYVPHVLLVPKGGEFGMTSSDPVLHNVHMTGAELYNIPFPIENHLVKRPFNRLGVTNLKCDAGHVWMNAVVLTVENPYYAITDANGNYTIKDIPAGTYTIEAWHEGWHVAREESVMDVDANQMVNRPIFTEPLTWDEKVTVPAKGTVKADFTLSEK